MKNFSVWKKVGLGKCNSGNCDEEGYGEGGGKAGRFSNGTANKTGQHGIAEEEGASIEKDCQCPECLKSSVEWQKEREPL